MNGKRIKTLFDNIENFYTTNYIDSKSEDRIDHIIRRVIFKTEQDLKAKSIVPQLYNSKLI